MRDILKPLMGIIFVILMLSACGGKKEPAVINYDLPKAISAIDPQFSTGTGSKTIINNVFEGLLRYDENGGVELAAAESYHISDDGLTYTFKLRDGIKWSDGTAISSKDFAFGISRLFYPLPSPFASEFLSIKNATGILSGYAQADSLGVFAPDDKTLVINLEYKNPSFLSLMAHTSAMPCNEQFFLNQKGRYATSIGTTLFNGSFVPTKWNSNLIMLLPNQNHHSKPPSGGVDIFFGRGNGAELFAQGKNDVYLLPYESISISEGYEYKELFSGSWSLIFNTASDGLSDPLVRQALLSVIDKQDIGEIIKSPVSLTDGFVPNSAMVSLLNYRELVGYPKPAQKLEDPKKSLYNSLALLNQTKLPKITIAVSDIAPNQEVGSYVQRRFRDELSVFANLEVIPNDQLAKRLENGSFQLIIAPATGVSTSAYAYLSPFSSSASNYTAYSNPSLDLLLQEAMRASSEDYAGKILLQAEQQIINDFLLMPLFTTPTRLVWQKGVSGLIFSPATNLIDFSKTVKNSR